ncbi:MAG TPA: GerMN domain-containing protein [Candidatus Aquilonibacter sp.]|nr:GerMN domain-containing protein [Candidatus Aquilonibacter sp.]
MKGGRALALIVLFVIVAAGAWYFLRSRTPSGAGDHLAIYYTKMDGTTLGTWSVSMRPRQSGESAAEHLHNTVLYAAVQAVAGPPSEIQAIRFPPGTHVQTVSVNGTTATVDLSKEVTGSTGGSFAENGEFKGLVYTVTGISPVNAVQITIEGQKVNTLPGGHLELDTPLRRSDW